ncbi:DUF3570 domain-containing protein [Neptunitalea lumnitzerae]|uniref:DUF3570 domain-containing protein n=1 Tax=Neptunitalea lumnitzerae TaxID=2965509 RepID=A0ABQ5MJB6_9FLAO|nr:DUF3570 domain-containing protein [Neptunitalea sp. Y10]GLB49480.1 hypothetical protein Y10_18480 [Neptunitalea sp. Y10]
MKESLILILFLLGFSFSWSQTNDSIPNNEYKKRVLESTEVDFLASYYTQDGTNAAVTGGLGDEHLTDGASTITVSIPLNDDDQLIVDAGISAYTSASSSNVNPFDGNGSANAFQASSGASSSDVWANFNTTYSHSSDDRNTIWTGKFSVASEYDYFSLGFGGSYTKLFNEKNTELGFHGSIYLDTWSPIYPIELRPFSSNGNGLNNTFFNNYTITGNTNYTPIFSEFTDKNRNSYSGGFSLSQIFSKRAQGIFMMDVVQQNGLLSTPFQRVYFSDVADSYIENFHLADAIEQLPDNRLKIAIGGRFNYYVNEFLVLKTFYRYYFDNWGVGSHTASIEAPIKIGSGFTLYPAYRYYNQSAADYFAPYEAHVSTESFYTSDYDLSKFNANQFSLGISYTDIFTKFKLWKLRLKSIDLKYSYYERNTGFSANIISGGLKFITD